MGIHIFSRQMAFAAAFILAVLFVGVTSTFAAEDNASVANEARGQDDKTAAKPAREEQMAPRPEQKSPDADATGPEQQIYPGAKRNLIRLSEPGKPSINFYYPTLGNEDIDALQKSFAEDCVRTFMKEIENDEPENMDLSATYAISRPNENVASIAYTIYSFEGGAHGDLAIVCFNVDMATGKVLNFSDIFHDPAKAVELISDIAGKKLAKDLGEESDEEMIRNGTAPDEENFRNLVLTPDSVVVEFQPYQVGPWSIGQQEVSIPVKDLEAAGPSPQIWPNIGNGETKP